MDKKVGAMGIQKTSTDYLISFKLVEEHKGKYRLIKALPIEVY